MPIDGSAVIRTRLELLRLRDAAKQALGDRFSLRDYHNVVLTTGVVPLDILAREVGRSSTPRLTR